MFKLLPLLIITTLLASSCSTSTPESNPEYDQKELNAYKKCLANNNVDGLTGKILTQSDLERCEDLKLKKK